MPAVGYMRNAPPFITDFIGDACPDWWTGGCGLDGCFSVTADVLEAIAPFVETFASAIWVFGSPLAFPLVFCFDPSPHTNESSGWQISMLQAPCRRPLTCICATVCFPCGQWFVRRNALGGDMTRYKLWQGYHDGPQCCARSCPGTFITVESGSYGEQNCPNTFLCLEVWCLGGMCSPCCAFNVSRRLMKEERGLSVDPTEARQEKCVDFFGQFFRACWKMACCVGCAGCMVGCCAPDSEGAQECSGNAGRASRACCSIARTLWRGIWATRIIAMGCMSAQMIHEGGEGKPIVTEAPKSLEMDREETPDKNGKISDGAMPNVDNVDPDKKPYSPPKE